MKPCKRFEAIRKIRKLGLTGPVSGGKHQAMIYQDRCRLAIPSIKEYDAKQLKMLLSELSLILGRRISDDVWNSL